MSRTVPLTPMLQLYREFVAHPGLRWAEQWLLTPEADPAALAHTFERSLRELAGYENECQAFHDHAPAAGFSPPLPGYPAGPFARGARFAAALIAGTAIDGLPTSAAYVDRELDCLRTNPGSTFPDGSSTKRALIPDLLLRHPDGFPILAELKIKNDKNPTYAFVQVVAAAAHLVTRSQRKRLARVYEALRVPAQGPCLDLWVILHEPPATGLFPKLTLAATSLAEQAMRQAQINRHIRDIRVLITRDAGTPGGGFRDVSVLPGDT